MISLQPEALEAVIRWFILLGGPLSTGSIDTVHTTGPSVRTATGPLQPIGGFRIISTLTRELSGLSGLGGSGYGQGPLLVPFVNPVTDAYLAANAQQVSFIPLQGDPDLDALISKLKAAILLPGWVGTTIKWTGLITLVIGLIAYFVSPTLNNRQRGFVMATTGFVLSIIGFGFPIFIRLLDYVLSG
jgi:hypothetical protein